MSIIGRLCVVLQKGKTHIPMQRFNCDGVFVHQWDREVKYEQPWAGVVVDVQSLLHDDGVIESLFLVADSEGAVFPVPLQRIRLQISRAEKEPLAQIDAKLPSWSENEAKAISKQLEELPDGCRPAQEWLAARENGGS